MNDKAYHDKMERQFQDYVRNGSYEFVYDPNGTYGLNDPFGPYRKVKRRKNVKKVRQLIDIMKTLPPHLRP